MKTLAEVRANCTIEDGHWLWNGGAKKHTGGRPVIYAPDITQGGKMVSQPGLRAVYHLATGKVIPAGHRVYGLCDELLCVNPKCIGCMSEVDWGARQARLGTQRGLTKRILANRAIGRARAKLTPEIVREIQQSTKTGRVLAAEFGLGTATVSRAKRGECCVFQSANMFSGLGAR